MSCFYARGESSDTCTIVALIKKTFFAFPTTYNLALQGNTRVGGSSPTPFPAGPMLQLQQVAQTGRAWPRCLRDPFWRGEMPVDPPSPPPLRLSKHSSPSLSLYALASTHHHHGVPGLTLLWGSLGAPSWSQHPAVASPSLLLSRLAQPRAHTPVSRGPQRDQGSSSCIQRLLCGPNFLPLLPHELLKSKMSNLSLLPRAHQTLSEGTIPG